MAKEGGPHCLDEPKLILRGPALASLSTKPSYYVLINHCKDERLSWLPVFAVPSISQTVCKYENTRGVEGPGTRLRYIAMLKQAIKNCMETEKTLGCVWTKSQQYTNFARKTAAKRSHLHFFFQFCFQFQVSIPLPFPAFPYAHFAALYYSMLCLQIFCIAWWHILSMQHNIVAVRIAYFAKWNKM